MNHTNIPVIQDLGLDRVLSRLGQWNGLTVVLVTVVGLVGVGLGVAQLLHRRHEAEPEQAPEPKQPDPWGVEVILSTSVPRDKMYWLGGEQRVVMHPRTHEMMLETLKEFEAHGD